MYLLKIDFRLCCDNIFIFSLMKTSQRLVKCREVFYPPKPRCLVITSIYIDMFLKSVITCYQLYQFICVHFCFTNRRCIPARLRMTVTPLKRTSYTSNKLAAILPFTILPLNQIWKLVFEKNNSIQHAHDKFLFLVVSYWNSYFKFSEE